MSPSLDFYAHQRNVGWRERGLERTPAQFSSPQTPHAIIDNRSMLLFSSSDYLGLSEHPFLKKRRNRSHHFSRNRIRWLPIDNR